MPLYQLGSSAMSATLILVLGTVAWLDDLYVGALILGGGYLVFSLLLGGLHGSDAGDIGADAHADIGGDADVGGHDLGSDHGGLADAHHGHDLETIIGGPRRKRVIGFASPMVLSLLLACFGLVGFAFLRSVGQETWTLAPAIAGGLFVALVLVRLVNTLAARATPATAVNVRDVVGIEANVIVPINPGSVGQVAFIVKGQRCTSAARSQNDKPIARDQAVVITRVEKHTCYVVPKER
jgi:hypothetical protein